MAPTFSEDIRPLFTQYDRIKMSFFCDLWDYSEVKPKAQQILLSLQEDPKQPNSGWSLLPGVHVMPLYTGPWSRDQIALFKAWIDGGCQPGNPPPAPPAPDPQLPAFIDLSEHLTGFDNLGANLVLAQTYFDLISEASGATKPNEILSVWKSILSGSPADLDALIAKQIMANSALALIAQKIILLWYNASVYSKLDCPPNQLPHQYTEGLVWKAILAHPMGYAVENVPFYWQYYPQNGSYTGAG
jgi:hypothetical protein